MLDDPVSASLTGPHARFAEWHGRAVRYRADVTPFAAAPDGAWGDLAALAGPGGEVTLLNSGPAPAAWETVMTIEGVQLVDAGVRGATDTEAVALTQADVPEMIALVERTRPGPFLPGTIELGAYLGIRRGGALVAMAGERLRPPGWTEISAVCTDPAFRGQGLAARLVRAVVAGIRARDERPFLHTMAANTSAIRLYESLGFRLRRRMVFVVLRAPRLSTAASLDGAGSAHH